MDLIISDENLLNKMIELLWKWVGGWNVFVNKQNECIRIKKPRRKNERQQKPHSFNECLVFKPFKTIRHSHQTVYDQFSRQKTKSFRIRLNQTLINILLLQIECFYRLIHGFNALNRSLIAILNETISLLWLQKSFRSSTFIFFYVFSSSFKHKMIERPIWLFSWKEISDWSASHAKSLALPLPFLYDEESRMTTDQGNKFFRDSQILLFKLRAIVLCWWNGFDFYNSHYILALGRWQMNRDIYYSLRFIKTFIRYLKKRSSVGFSMHYFFISFKSNYFDPQIFSEIFLRPKIFIR